MGVQCPREVLEKKQKAEPTGEELPSLGKHCKEGVTGFASEQRFLGRHIIQLAALRRGTEEDFGTEFLCSYEVFDKCKIT